MKKHSILLIVILGICIGLNSSCRSGSSRATTEQIIEIEGQVKTQVHTGAIHDCEPLPLHTTHSVDSLDTLNNIDTTFIQNEVLDYINTTPSPKESQVVPATRIGPRIYGGDLESAAVTYSSHAGVAATAGKLTAGEINDFQKWKLWNDLTENELKKYVSIWKIKPEQRYCVIVQNKVGHAIADCIVRLVARNNTILWTSRTDNTGKAELWTGIGDNISAQVDHLSIEYAGRKFKLNKPKRIEDGVNSYRISTECHLPQQVDLLFAVDATGSMGDEIAYLRAELLDILKRVQEQHNQIQFHTGALFYRDHGDEYLTRYSLFNRDVQVTNQFINQQMAAGGGDGPEAVDDALEVSVNTMNWSDQARARLLFLILDAPPHSEQKNIQRLKQTMRTAAEKGIRIIPLVASGGGFESDKSMEYLMRSIALATNGTYAFLTDHSGIGNKHTAPSTDHYEVETLNRLLLRLIDQFVQMPPCQSQDWSEVVEEPKDTIHAEVKITTMDSLNVDKPIQPTIIMKAYPNPARDYVMITCERPITELWLTDNSGKIVARQLPDASTIRLDLIDYPTGIYLIKAKVEDQWITVRIVVAK